MDSMKKGPGAKPHLILEWVERQDPDLADAIRYLSLDKALRPMSGQRDDGVTLLYPRDAEYRKKITEMAYDPEEIDKVSRIVESLIIPVALTQGRDFRRGPIGNKAGVKLGVESASAQRVILSNGVELTPEKSFGSSAGVAVWGASKGRLAALLEGEPYTPPDHSARRKTKGGASGGARGGARGGGTLSARQALAVGVEGAYSRSMAADWCRDNNPYLAKVVSLLNCLRVKAPETFLKVLPVIDYDPLVTFYLLLEPYKTRGEYLIPDDLLFGDGAWNGCEAYGNAVAEYEAIFRGLPGQQALSATAPQTGAAVVPYVFSDRSSVATQVDLARQQLGAMVARTLPQAVIDAYTALATQNTILAMGPVLPDATKAALPGLKKLWQDELRFILHNALGLVRQQPVYRADEFAIVVDELRMVYPGNDYGAELTFCNPAALKANVSPRDALIHLTKFVNSTDFLYLPIAPETVGGAWGTMSLDDPEVYNRNHDAYADLRRTTGMVNPSGISQGSLGELQQYVDTHGELPPAVLALAPGGPR